MHRCRRRQLGPARALAAAPSRASAARLLAPLRPQIGVLQWFARLWEIDADEMWGYVTNCGTEGNLHGILVGRETLPDGILYSSKETHYSVFKAARMYRMEAVKASPGAAGARQGASRRQQGRQAAGVGGVGSAAPGRQAGGQVEARGANPGTSASRGATSPPSPAPSS